MDFAFTSEQDMLRDTVRRFLEERAPVGKVREVMDRNTGFDPALWAEMAQLGLPAMHIPEEFGGAGFGQLELGIVMEELGRALTPVPMLSSIVLGANLVMINGTADQRGRILPGVAGGEHLLAVAILDENGSWSASGRATTATVDGDSFVLRGTKSYVVDGQTADTLIVGATIDGVLDFYLIDANGVGVRREPLETMDQTRRQSRIMLEDVQVAAASRLGAPGSGESALKTLSDFAAVALAFEQVGGAQKCLETAVEYAKARRQFGRLIGSFQAVKHKCAEMLIEVESAKSIAYYAGWALAVGDNEAAIMAAVAKSYCSDAFAFCAAANIQVHGGIGFTWEHDAHLYFKRAKTSQLMLGDSTHWRAVLAERLGV